MRLALIALVSGSTLLMGATADPTPSQIDQIIQKFAAKEAAFAKARENYTYRQTVKIEELDSTGNTTGKWEMVSDIIFSPEGKQTEKVVYAPVPSLHNILLTPQDLQDLRDVQPFVLTTQSIPDYEIRYLGRQKLDEISCYEFTVRPKSLEPGKRYFEGEIWVDDQDLQIVKTYGKGIGRLKKNEDNQFPKFETYREQIDGKYWFPTYTYANDTLQFQTGPQRLKMIMKYEDYKQFKSNVNITFGDTVDPGQKPKAPPEKQPELPKKQ